MEDLIVIIMAGGLGKRMNSELPKVLHKVKGKPMIIHVIYHGLMMNGVIVIVILWNVIMIIINVIVAVDCAPI